MRKKIIIGLLSGFITGLFATGGGTILIPTFVYWLKIDEKVARATSICCVLPAVIISFLFYMKEKYNYFSLIIFLISFLIKCFYHH